MRKVKLENKSKLILTNIEGFVKRQVTKFGNSAKVSCPKEFLGKKAYLAIIEDER